MSLLIVLIAENSHILVGVYFIILKNVLYQICKAFNTKIGSWQILVRFSKFVTKSLEVTKFVKQIEFEGLWKKLKVETVARDNYLQDNYDKL